MKVYKRVKDIGNQKKEGGFVEIDKNILRELISFETTNIVAVTGETDVFFYYVDSLKKITKYLCNIKYLDIATTTEENINIFLKEKITEGIQQKKS